MLEIKNLSAFQASLLVKESEKTAFLSKTEG
jgi:hypothetical protein